MLWAFPSLRKCYKVVFFRDNSNAQSRLPNFWSTRSNINLNTTQVFTYNYVCICIDANFARECELQNISLPSCYVWLWKPRSRPLFAVTLNRAGKFRQRRANLSSVNFWIVASKLGLNHRRKTIKARFLVHCEYTNAFHIAFHSWTIAAHYVVNVSRSGRIHLFSAGMLSQRSSTKYFRFLVVVSVKLGRDLSCKPSGSLWDSLQFILLLFSQGRCGC